MNNLWKNFMIKNDNKVLFEEGWFDRCIDRYNPTTEEVEYIPMYPYWLSIYTPETWIEEGKKEVMDRVYELNKKMIDECDKRKIKINKMYFNEDSKLAPKMETGMDVYTIEEFLKLNHKEIEYEGYVYYGRSVIEFSLENDIELIENLIKDYVEDKF